jgi:elongation factor G
MRVGVRKLSSQSLGLHSIRNVGIIAHIDAGKTTTTERMLFFSGKSRNLGDVDDGNTVTDYLVEERQRGITIQSACVTFPWREHRINLIDSPGHVDFTFEVERSIRVLDGAVAILDGVAGVEAQTETVWRQSLRYNVPRMVYINKLDRDGSSFSRSLESLRNKFPLSCFVPIQFPILTKGFAPIVGLVDLVDQMEMRWKGDRGQDMEEIDVSESHPLYEEFEIRRGEMIETLADHSDVIAEHFLESIPVSRALLKKEIRSLVADGKIVPVLCGSSYKNLGVQTLLDAVCDYLPSPLERPDVAAHEMILEGGLLRTGSRKALKSDPRGDLCAMVFKVVYDPRRGPVNFVRVFSGTLNAKDLVSLSRLSKGSKGVPPAVIKERAARILELYGSDWNDVESVSAGNICAIVGMKNAHTGDTISGGSRQKPLKLDGISIPDPVFSASIEAHSTSDEVG